MDPVNPTPGAPEAADDPARRRAAEHLIGALQKAVRIVGYFSAQHQAATAALDEIVDVATQVTNDFTEIALKLTGDGLYVGEHRITHYSPTEDPHLFRLFHNGVRQLSFRAGISREDITGFLEAITADMSQPEFAEEDVITTLWARNIVGIRWVVVETFTEVEGEEDPEINARAADELSNFLDDSLRERLGGDLVAGISSSEDFALTLTGGDVRFFQAEAISTLVGSLPEQQGAAMTEAVYAIGTAESDALMAELGRHEPVMVTRFLDAVLAATAAGATPDDMQSAAQCIALTLGTIARQSGHAAIGDVFGRLVQWLATVPYDDKLAVAVNELVLGGQLLTGAVATIDSCADEDVPVVLSILGAAPPEGVLRVVRNVTGAKTRDRRRDAFAVLLRRPGGPELFGTMLRELDEDGATDVLDACIGLSSPVDAQPVATSASLHASATVRARGVQMLARCGIDMVLPRVADKLFDPDGEVRIAALRAMASTGKSAEHLRAALQSPEITELSLPEKRLIALLLAHVEGMRAAPLLHMLLGRKAIFGAVQNDEVRAAAAAGLGYIPDPRALASLERIAKSSFSTAPLRAEARKVAEALARSKAAYDENDLRTMLTPPKPAEPTAPPRSRSTTAGPPPPARPSTAPAPARPSAAPPPARPTAPPPPARPTAPPLPSAAPTPAPAATPAPVPPPAASPRAASPLRTPPPFEAPLTPPPFQVPGAITPAPLTPAPTPPPTAAVPPITGAVVPPTTPRPSPALRPSSAPATPMAPTPPGLPTSAMYTPKMGTGIPPVRPEPRTITEQHRRASIDALLEEFNAVDEPFGPSDLAPRHTPTAADQAALDEPLADFGGDFGADFGADLDAPAPVPGGEPQQPAAPLTTKVADSILIVSDTPPVELAEDQAQVLSGYMFEDEQGNEFTMGAPAKPAQPEDLQDLLRSYLEGAS